MWAQSWERLYEFTRPYPNINDVNPTTAMINQVNTKKLIIVQIRTSLTHKTYLLQFRLSV